MTRSWCSEVRLHTLNKAPGDSDAIRSCLRAVAGDDCLLLLEDAVYAACPGQADDILSAGCKLFVLEPDAAARGLLGRLDPAVELVDYAGFVALAAECSAVQSWY